MILFNFLIFADWEQSILNMTTVQYLIITNKFLVATLRNWLFTAEHVFPGIKQLQLTIYSLLLRLSANPFKIALLPNGLIIVRSVEKVSPIHGLSRLSLMILVFRLMCRTAMLLVR